MTSTDVIWMRHGTCTDGRERPDAHARPGSPLHPDGLAQVTAAARSLVREGWRPALIITSPLPRAAASAAAVGLVADRTEIHQDDLLREWAAPACVLGRGPSDYSPEYLAWRSTRLVNVDTALPGGESLRSLRDRAVSASARINSLAQQYGAVLVVSHQVLIGCVAAAGAGVHDVAEVFEHARTFRLEPAGLWHPQSSQLRSPEERRP
ncbi:histidine phosphatase family protein [Dactylosporangium cerinum]|uniref:Histidine phosphatase family protein n=1 Tax=Dactylosporangium cerinum TaxID=1434730 RepID=A0ABV9VU73_9ACTN